MGNNSRIKFAIVGMGRIGKRHAALIKDNPHAELVAYCDISVPATTGVDDEGIAFFSSLESMLTSTIHIDVVNICTPNGMHAAQTISALKTGCSVVCEKPIALSVFDAVMMAQTATQYGKNIFCVMQNRYSQPSVWLKNAVTSQLLGDIYMVQINCFWNRDERYYLSDSWHGDAALDGGTLFTQFSHFIDTLYWIFGDISNISASFRDFSHGHLTDFEDSGIVSFDVLSGGIGSLNYSTAVWDSNLESSITVIGSKGSVKIAGQYMDSVEFCNIKDYDAPMFSAELDPIDHHRSMIQNVIDTVRGCAEPDSTVSEGLKVVEIIERIYAKREKE